ncbi:MAG: hypothetical protein ACXVCY_03900 [Pseudobdellovibrionaceae bacterium]
MLYQRLWPLLIVLLLPTFSSAEYRVFLLKISKKAAPTEAVPSKPAPSSSDSPASSAPLTQTEQTAQTGADFRLVESTLDPQQYRSYYPVASDEEISYIATWRCYGRTDNFLPHCPNPKGQIPPAKNP